MEKQAFPRSQRQSECLNWSAGCQANPFQCVPVQAGPHAQGHHKGSATPLVSPSNWWQSPLQGCLSTGFSPLPSPPRCSSGKYGFFVIVQSLSHVRHFATPWTPARQASLSFTISWSLLKFMPIESAIPFNYLTLCHPLLLPSIFPSIRIFSNKLALHISWPKY